MYKEILKKDLKRRKTMNIILLLFIILSSMFVSSSVRNIVTVSNALDHYFELAGMSNLFVATKDMTESDTNCSQMLDGIEDVDSYGVEPALYCSRTNLSRNGKNLKLAQTGVMFSFSDAVLNYFTDSDEQITKLDAGEIYMHKGLMEENNLSAGDRIQVTVGNTTIEAKLLGSFKDAFLGSDMMGMSRVMLSESDMAELMADPESEALSGELCYIFTDEVEAVEQTLNKTDGNIIFVGSQQLVKTTYIMDLIIAGVLLIASICLILIAFVVLRFTIFFTLSEEFREIGVMKAIGIKGRSIRLFYLVKYFVIAVIGAFLGFLGGIVFGNVLLKSVSESIVMQSNSGLWLSALCSLLVVAIILLFCYRCTKRVDKFSPIDAIRNGNTGERFQKRTRLALSKSRLKPSIYLALNDLFCDLKRYLVMLIAFTISMLFTIIIVNTINTLQSDKLLETMSITQSDVYLVNESDFMSFFATNGHEIAEKRLAEIEETLKQKSIPCSTSLESCLKLTLENGDYTCKSSVFQGINTTTDQYTYAEGTAPQNIGEIACTVQIANKLHADIGDTITLDFIDGPRDMVITALYQSLNNLGEGVRLHEDLDISYSQLSGVMSFQITYTDSPSKETIAERRETIHRLFPDCLIYNGSEYVDSMIGGAASMMEGVRNLVVFLLLIICVLVVILMERSFIAKEKGEIAVLKATGFRDRTLIEWHELRILFVLVCSAVLAALLSTPLTKLSSGQIFKHMGAELGITFDIRPLEAFVLYPLLFVSGSLIAGLLTAQTMRAIKASDTANIE